VEESPEVLANMAASAAASTNPTRVGVEGAELGESVAGAEPEVVEPIHIVRATAKLRLDPTLVRPLEGSVEDTDSARLAMWKLLQKQLYDTQRAVAFGMNAVIRAMWSDDGARLDAFVAANGRVPKSKEWPAPEIKGYKIVRAVSPGIASPMASVASRTAWQHWSKWRYDALIRQTRSPPHFRDTCPIPLRAKEVGVTKAGWQRLLGYLCSPGRPWPTLAGAYPAA
jgi:hypothetical protein